MRVRFGSTVYKFPDEATEDQIQEFLQTQHSEEVYKSKGGGLVSSFNRGIASQGITAALAASPGRRGENTQEVLPKAEQLDANGMPLYIEGTEFHEPNPMLRRNAEALAQYPRNPIIENISRAYDEDGLGAAVGQMSPGLMLDYTTEMLASAAAGGGVGGKIAQGGAQLLKNTGAALFQKKLPQNMVIGSGVNAGATASGSVPMSVEGELASGKDTDEAVRRGLTQAGAETGVAAVFGMGFPVGGTGLKATAAKVLGLSPLDEATQTLAGNAAVGEETSGGELFASAVLGAPTAPVEIGTAYLLQQRDQRSLENIEEEIISMAREQGLITDENGMTTIGDSEHTINEERAPLPSVMPMFANENGALTNEMPAPDAVPVMVPTKGEGVQILEGSIEENVAAGEITFDGELKETLENETFSEPQEALKIATQLQAKLGGVNYLHQVDANGRTQTIDLSQTTPEELIAKLEGMKTPEGLKIETPIQERLTEQTPDTILQEAQLTRQEELRYRMLNPVTPERQAEIRAKLERMEAGKNLPDSPNATNVDALDQTWQKGVESGVFEPDVPLSPDVGGITEDVQTAREERYAPEILPPSMRTIEVSSVKETEGLTLRKIDKQAGTFGIGGNERSFPREYKEAVVALAEAVRTKFMSPDTMLVINFENFSPDRDMYGKVMMEEGQPMFSTMGAHFRLDDGTHVITPRELASWDKYKSVYNKLTVNEAIYSLSHELGHAVWLNEFYRDFDPKYVVAFQNLFAADDIAGIKELLDIMPEAQRQVVAEWIALREQIPTQSAAWFAENWIGVRKLALGVGKYKNTQAQKLYAWAEKQLNAHGLRWEGASALDLIHAMYADDSLSKEESDRQAERYLLSFNEYMAEQFTRYAYVNKIPESTLANNAFFQRALNALRNFFKSLKTSAGGEAEAVVAPGTKYEEWISKLSHLYGNIDGVEVKGKKRKPRAKPGKRKTPKVSNEIIAAAPEESAQVMSDEVIERSFKAVLPLLRREDPYAYEQVRDLIEYGSYEEANIIIREVLGKSISFDKTYSSKLLTALPVRDFYSLEYLTNFAKQPWVRQGDKNAIAELVDMYALEGRVPYEDVRSTIIVHAVPLKAEESDSYIAEGFDRINLWGAPFTVVLTTELTTWFKNHFGSGAEFEGNYFGHFRGSLLEDTEKTTIAIVEVQSDVMQKLKSKRVNEYENLPLENEEFQTYMPDAYSKLLGISKDWHYRMLAEINADAKSQKIERVRLAHENTMGLAEGWLRTTDLSPTGNLTRDLFFEELKDVEASTALYQGQKFTGEVSIVGPGLENVYFEVDRAGNGREMVGIVDVMSINPDLIKNQAFKTRLDQEVKAYRNDYRNVDFQGDYDATVSLDVEYMTLYKRHRELRQLAEKAYGATKIVDENGFVWYEYDLTPQMETVIAFDASTPAGGKAKNAIDTMARFKDRNIIRAMNFTARAGMAASQLQQIAAVHPDILPLRIFTELTQGFTRFKNQLMFRPQTVATEWLKLGARQSELLEKIMLAEKETGEHQTKLVKTGDFYSHVASPEFLEWLETQGVNTGTEDGKKLVEMFLQIKNSHQHQMNVLQAVLRDLIWKKYNRDTAVFGEKWREYQGLFIEMRSKPFLPTMQFGNYVLYVQKRLPHDKGGESMQTIYRRHYESKAERDEAYLKLKMKQQIGETVNFVDLKDSQTVTLAIPYDFIQTVADTGNFTQDQVTLLQELLIPTRAEKFQKRWIAANDDTAGSSDNLFRNYVAYSWHNANFIAKLKYNSEFNRAIGGLRSEINRLSKTRNIPPEKLLEEIQLRDRILDNMKEIKQDLMYPAAEFEATRSAIALLYLNFLIKTALMNFSTMFHTVFGAQVEYGEIAGTKAFNKSLWLIKNSWGEPTDLGGLKFSAIEEKIAQSRGKEESYWRSIKYALDRATHEGVVDQSFAYMLAGMATSGTRMKMYQKYPRSRYLHQAIDAGMIPFRAVEKANRIVSLLTFFQLELEKNGGDATKAYEHAASRTLILQNDYSKGNRPKLLRGKASLVTIFLSFAQFMAWLTTGGHDRTLRREAEARGDKYKGPAVNFTARMWLTYLMFGGLMGLPFAENIMDLINFIMKKFFNRPDMEYQLRKYIEDVTGHEAIVMNGLMHNVPTPLGSVDLSASFGLGRLIPGTGPLGDMMPDDNFAETVGKTAIGVTGVFGDFVNSLWDFAAADTFDDKMKSLPGIAGQIGKAMDSYEHGIMTRAGVRVHRDEETGEFISKDGTVMARQLMGFNIAEASKARERAGMAYEIANYYTTKRSMLLRNRNFAYLRGDAEDRKDADMDIRRFNESLPKEFSGMMITQKTMNQSFRTYRNNIVKKENNIAPSRQQRGVYNSVNQLFDESP